VRDFRTYRACLVGAAASLMLASLAACGGHDEPPPELGSPGRPLFSPNGEPLSGGPLGRPPCAEALSRWFDRVDANHDGIIDLDEYLADARRQFTAMDLDGDGFITPVELDTYRAPYGAAPVQNPPKDGKASRDDERKAANTSAQQPDPVMAADTSLRYRVSLPDFLAYARRRFTGFDRNRDGRVTKAAILRSCEGS
jgi:EF hand domain-containing protein